MDLIGNDHKFLKLKHVVFFLFIVVFITIPVKGAIKPRGQILKISVGNHYVPNAENFSGFYYSITKTWNPSSRLFQTAIPAMSIEEYRIGV